MRLLGTATALPGHEPPRTLSQLADQLNVGFHVYRMLVKNELKGSDVVKQELTKAVLGEIHGRLGDFWGQTFTPKIRDGYRVLAPDLSDEFVSAAAGKFSGRMAEQINDVSDRAFIEGYNAALNKGWDRAIAWQKIADAWGLDPVQMRSWVTYYPEGGYHSHIHPQKAETQLDDFLTIRAKRISEHEARTIVNMGQQAEWTGKYRDYSNLKKVYRTAEDELVCSVCGPLDGAIVDLNDQFEGFFMPPLHVNCRCSVHLIDENSIVKRDNRPLKRRSSVAVQYEVPTIKPERSPIEPDKRKVKTQYEVPETVESVYDPRPQTARIVRVSDAKKPNVKIKSKMISKPPISEVNQPRLNVRGALKEFVRPRGVKASELNEMQRTRSRTRSSEQVAVHTRAEHEAKMQARQEARQRQIAQWRREVRSGVQAQEERRAPTARGPRLGNTDWAQVDRRNRRYVTTDNPSRQYVSKRLRMKYGSD